MKTSLHILLIIIVCFFTVITKSQTTSEIIAFSSSGGNASGGGGSVSFSIGQVVYSSCTGANGSIEQGIQHHYTDPFDLPIELISFTGQCNENIVELKWITTSEVNNDYFTVERSTNNATWEVVGQVDGAGNSNSYKSYLFSDTEEHSGILYYYRFQQTDYDGRFNYSNIIAVESCNEDLMVLKVYPNPVIDYLELIAGSNNNFALINLTFSLYGIDGTLLENKKIESNETTISMENLVPATYFLKVLQDNKELEIFKIIKN